MSDQKGLVGDLSQERLDGEESQDVVGDKGNATELHVNVADAVLAVTETDRDNNG